MSASSPATCRTRAWSRPSSRICGRPDNARDRDVIKSLLRQRRESGTGGPPRRCAPAIAVAIDVLLHQERGAAVEFFILLVTAAELGPDEIPGEPHQRHLGFGVGRGRAHVAIYVGRGLLALEIVQRGWQRDHRSA